MRPRLKATYRMQGILLLIIWAALGGSWLFEYFKGTTTPAKWFFWLEMAISLCGIAYAVVLICRKPREEEE